MIWGESGFPPIPTDQQIPPLKGFRQSHSLDEISKCQKKLKKHVTERPHESICITITNSEKKYFSFDFFSERLNFFGWGGVDLVAN